MYIKDNRKEWRITTTGNKSLLINNKMGKTFKGGQKENDARKNQVKKEPKMKPYDRNKDRT